MGFPRREFFVLTGGALASAALGGCDSARPSPASKTKPNETPKPSITTEQGWMAASPRSRLQLLEQRGLSPTAYPEMSNFNPKIELARAVAGVYCEVTNCTISAETMAANVHFLQTDAFIDEYAKEYQRLTGREASEEDRQKERAQPRLEFASQFTNEVFMHEPGILAWTTEAKSGNSDTVRQLGKVDFYTKIVEDILFHGFTHINTVKTSTTFPAFSFIIPSTNGPIRVDTMDRIENLMGVGRSNGQPIYISGTNEALTETIAKNIAVAATGQYISFQPHYRDGMKLIDELNLKAKISEKELIQLNRGFSLDELLRRWGALKNPQQPDVKAAAQALIMIGLCTQRTTTYENARQVINNGLSPQTQR